MAAEIALLLIAFALVFSVIFGATLIVRYVIDVRAASPASWKSIHHRERKDRP